MFDIDSTDTGNQSATAAICEKRRSSSARRPSAASSTAATSGTRTTR